MRKTKQFTPDLLDRYKKNGRGSGTFVNYAPWHQVTRDDPSSNARSHLQFWNGRHRHLLSDGEWIVFMFCTMLQNIIDIREQFPLQYEDGMNELSAYSVYYGGSYPTTIEIASLLGYKHPLVHGNGRSAIWVMTTDILLTLTRSDGSYYLLAVAHKPINYLEKKRTSQLLEIERAYWEARNVEWLLITPNEYTKAVALTLRNACSWGLSIPAQTSHMQEVVEKIHRFNGVSLTTCLIYFTESFGSMDLAQRSFWQCVWSGRTPIDLTRGWRPSIPIRLISSEEFWQFNPIASRRTSWN